MPKITTRPKRRLVATLTVRLPAEIIGQLYTRAAQMGREPSLIVQDAIIAWLDTVEVTAE